MIFKLWDGKTIDTQKDLSAEERHIVQKLMAWESLVKTIEEFRAKKAQAFEKGWNNSGPVKERSPLTLIIKDMEKKVISRLLNS